ncbi:MAG: glycosyltransferase, partial [Acidimicrobiales bacterium]
VNTVHGLYAQPHDRLAKRAAVYSIERVAAAFSHAELVQNGEDLAVLRRLGVGSAKLRLLGNGIDLCRFDPARAAPAAVAATRAELGVAPSDVLCLAVGRLVAEKGYRELCAAAERLRNPFPNLRVVIAGPDEPAKRDAITDRERAHWAGIAGVHFLGHRADVFELYAASDIYVLASHREGFPRSAMEAAAMGLPIVATDIRGCRQVVEHGRTGLTVPVGEVGALARALATLAADPDRRQAMGGLARVKAEREFDQRRVIDLTLETYARLLRGRPRQDAGAAMNHPAPVTTP